MIEKLKREKAQAMKQLGYQLRDRESSNQEMTLNVSEINVSLNERKNINDIIGEF